MSTCGTCQNGKSYPKDLSKRVCKGAPPQVTLVPTPQGPALQNMWPLVAVADESCGAYKPKPPIIDVTTGKVVDVLPYAP